MDIHHEIKWDLFNLNLRTSLQDIRNKKELFDVTLVCEDEEIPCHKLVLSASSSFFRNMFSKHHNPLIYLVNINIKDLSKLVDFMYNGEVEIKEENIRSFLATAEILKVKGLHVPNPSEYLAADPHVTSDVDSEDRSETQDAEFGDLPTLGNPESQSKNISKPTSSTSPEENIVIPLAFDHFLSQNMNTRQTCTDQDDQVNFFNCDICHEILKTKKLLYRHKKKQNGEQIPCDVCGKLYNRKDTMINHKMKFHAK